MCVRACVRACARACRIHGLVYLGSVFVWFLFLLTYHSLSPGWMVRRTATPIALLPISCPCVAKHRAYRPAWVKRCRQQDPTCLG